jgi:DNA-binding NarL/FixJ family response regulator
MPSWRFNLAKKKTTKSVNIRVVVVEDDENFRGQLVELIQGAEKFKLAGAYGDGQAALDGIPDAKADVVIMDIQLSGGNGVECVRALKKQLPGVSFLMLTVCEDSERLFESLKAGAGGYLLKRTSSTRLLEAIRELHEGGAPMTPQIARQVVQSFSDTSRNVGLVRLTPGETKTLHELAQGYAYKDIADHLAISVHGVRNYIRKIYEKLQVHSRTEAVIKYLRH